jgi:hypothetical protein
VALESVGASIGQIETAEPTLEDVFLALAQ